MTPETPQEIRDRASRGLMEIRRRHPNLPGGVYELITVGPPPDIPFEEILKGSPDSLFGGLLEWICWKRYRRPFWQLALEDAAGMPEASRKIERMISERNKLRYRKKLPGFKVDLDHTGLLEMGLSLGLDKLTAEELADCFEEMCPCGEEHDAEALKKQRARLLRAITAARAWWENPPQPVLDYISRKKQQKTNAASKKKNVEE